MAWPMQSVVSAWKDPSPEIFPKPHDDDPTMTIHAQTREVDVASALERCAAEPIHRPGTIQPHGFLIAADTTLVIRHVSTNVAEYLETPAAALLGSALAEVFGPDFVHQIENLRWHQETPPPLQSVSLQRFGVRFVGQAHFYEKLFLIELEPADRVFDDELFEKSFVPIRDRLWALEAQTRIETYMSGITNLIAELTGYDRIKVYRFDSHWDGEVISEVRNAPMPSYLGHRFPASDIPPQARALYLKNRTRLLVDADAKQVPIYPPLRLHTGQPLDLSFSTFRSISPTHLRYMGNMGVRASLTISLVSNGRLWGLIACHHRTPRKLSAQVREMAGFIGQTASLKIHDIEQKENRRKIRAARHAIDQLVAIIAQEGQKTSDTDRAEAEILGLLGASGMVICQDQRKHYIGHTPDIATLNHLIDWLRSQPASSVHVTDALGEEIPEARGLSTTLQGMLATPVDFEMDSYILWFRPGVVQTVKWAGNPEKVVEQVEDGVVLSPRKSFEAWVQSYEGRSNTWSFSDIDIARSVSLELLSRIAANRFEWWQAAKQDDQLTIGISRFIATLSEDLRYRSVSPELSRLLGYQEQDLLGRPVIDFVYADDVEDFHWHLIRCLARDPLEHGLVFRHSHKAGHFIWLELTLGADNQGAAPQASEPPALQVWLEDVTERQRYNAALERLNQQHSRGVETGVEAIVCLDATHRVIHANEKAHELLGYGGSSLIGQHFCSVHCQMAKCLHEPSDGSKPQASSSISIESRISHLQRLDREVFAVRLWGIRLGLAQESEPAEIIVFCPENNAIDTAPESDRESSVKSADHAGVFITNRNGVIEATNSDFTEITGYGSREAVGKTPALLRSGVHSPDFYKKFWRSLREQQVWRGEIWNRRSNGEVYPQITTVYPISGRDDLVRHYVAIFRDVGTARRSEEGTHSLPDHDALTGLQGRMRFEKVLEESIRRGPFALAFLDLANFKGINDALGHISADRLLYLVAARLKRQLRSQDSLARWGGDKFVFLLGQTTSAEDASEIMKRIQSVFVNPISIAGKHISPSSRVGIALHPHDGADVATLMEAADIALNHAKTEKSGLCVFSANLIESSKDRFETANDLQHGIHKHELFLAYQPQVDAVTGDMVGLEALVRWHHPERGTVGPGQFVSVAEEAGLIKELGSEILRMAFNQMRVWLDAGFILVPVGINISPMQVHPGFAEQIEALLQEFAIPPALLELEITESALKPTPEIRAIMNQLKSMGIKLAIDDFGTGYSSLSHLKLIPFDRLKIDKSFVDGLPDTEDDVAIAQTIIALGHALKVNVLAEGVETEAQADFLRNAGVHVIQGYFYGRPMDEVAVTERLRKVSHEPH